MRMIMLMFTIYFTRPSGDVYKVPLDFARILKFIKSASFRQQIHRMLTEFHEIADVRILPRFRELIRILANLTSG